MARQLRHSRLGRRSLAAGVAAAALAAAAPAAAQNVNRAPVAAQFDRPWGFESGLETQPYDPGTRDMNGNRVIVNGRIVVGDNLSTGLPDGLFNSNGLTTGGAGFSGLGAGNAIGNQLNVVTNGSYNTVVVDSTQINNGNQTVTVAVDGRRGVATAQSATARRVLNGELDLND